jgi:hypothetical protein
MAPRITIKKDYILVETKEGVDFREIKQGVARLFYVKGIPEQNRIWVIPEGPVNLSEDDLNRLKNMVKEYYPKDAKIRKTAIVVKTDLQKKFVQSFIEIAHDLPQTFGAFSSLADAENWVKE